MKFLKTLFVAGALAAAALTSTAATAAPKIGVVVGNNHARAGIVAGNNHGRVAIAGGNFHRGHIALTGGWYAAPAVYRSHAFFRGHPRLRACFLVTKVGFRNGRRALIGATMCYSRNGAKFVIPTSQYVVRWI